VATGFSAGPAYVAEATLIKRFHPAEGSKIAGVYLVSGMFNLELKLLARSQLGIETPDPCNEACFGTDFASHLAMSTVELVDAEPFPLATTYAKLDPIRIQVQTGELFARLVTHKRTGVASPRSRSTWLSTRRKRGAGGCRRHRTT
jgi:triacylglycerol lipase